MFWLFTNKHEYIGHYSKISCQGVHRGFWMTWYKHKLPNSTSFESESQGQELRFCFVSSSSGNSLTQLVWESLHMLAHVSDAIFSFLANSGSFFKIPFKFYLLWEDTSATLNTKLTLSYSFLSEHFIFIPLLPYVLHFAVLVLPFVLYEKMPSVPTATRKMMC